MLFSPALWLNVVGVDILPGMVERATERARTEGVAARVEFKVGAAQELPLKDDLFDVVLGEFITGLTHDKESAVREYVRVAKPGGTIGLNEATWLKTPPPREIIGFLAKTAGFKNELFTSEGWMDLLEKSGIKQIKARTYRSESISDLAQPVHIEPSIVQG